MFTAAATTPVSVAAIGSCLPHARTYCTSLCRNHSPTAPLCCNQSTVVQVLDGEIRLMPHVGVPERPIVGDGKNFPSRWQPKIPTSGTLGLEPVVYPH